MAVTTTVVANMEAASHSITTPEINTQTSATKSQEKSAVSGSTTTLQDGAGPEPGPEPGLESNFDVVKKSFSFWAIIIGLGVMLWLAALENSILTTAAPALLTEIPLGDNWIWLTNAFFLASAAFQPLLGQLADLFGRRWTTISVIIIFMLGSGICGGAVNGAMLIAGRAVQGVGSGGILMAYDTVVSDLVPLRYRGNYIAIILLIYSIGTTAGALVGGVIVDHASWRWVFYINLPIGGLALAIIFAFLHVGQRGDMAGLSPLARLRRIDYVGNGILIGSSVSMLIALTYAGTRYPWQSWQTLVPLLLGFFGFFIFAAYEATSKYPRFKLIAPTDPVMPPRLFATRTSVIIAINTFLFTAILYWAIFFLPVFFQAVQLASPTTAGVNVIPVSLLGIPAAAFAAFAVSRWGKYKAIHLLGFTLFTISLGVFSLLDEDSPKGMWIGFMFIGPVGGGLLLNTQLPAFQAPVPESDQAAATGCWNFIRTLGGVWGVAIPAAIFANRVDVLVAEGAVSNPLAAGLMKGGGAYQYASSAFIKAFENLADQAEIRAVYRQALQRTFLVGVAFGGVAWCLCWFEKDLVLRTELVTEYGLKEKEKEKGGGSGTDLERDGSGGGGGGGGGRIVEENGSSLPSVR